MEADWPSDPPRELANCWRLLKPGRGKASCDLWSHPLGRELRLTVNGDLLRSEVFRDLAWAEASVEWREAMYRKSWRRLLTSEPVGEV